MLVANSFDLWQKDNFFSAAEEVQQSADIMESAYRTWLRERRERLSPKFLDGFCRELQFALGTAKWQLEEFEKAVRMSYKNYADEITMNRHNQFVSAIKKQIFDVEAALRESFNGKGKKTFQWVTLDENERDDLALFLSGTSNTQSIKDGYTKLRDLKKASSSLGKDNGIKCCTLNEIIPKDQAEGCADAITCNIDVNSILQKEVEETPRTMHDASYVADGISSSKRTCNINALGIVVDDHYGQRSTLAADIEATPKEKGLKPFFQRLRTILSYPQLRRFCGINQFPVRFAGRHRQIQSPLTFPFSCCIRFTLVLMLTVFLVDLSTKKCVPCNTKDLRPMTQEAANQLMPQVAEWDLVNDGGTLKLHKSWKVKTFTKGLEFFQEVAHVAEAEGIYTRVYLLMGNFMLGIIIALVKDEA